MWNFPLFPEQASTNASRVDALALFELGIVLFFTALICIMILTFAVRYRRGSKVDRSTPRSRIAGSRRPGSSSRSSCRW